MQLTPVHRLNKCLEVVKNFFRKHWFNVLIFFVALLGVFLRAHVYLFNRSFWVDEAALANNLLLEHSILDNMTFQQAAPPLFKAISLGFVNLFGETEFAFRLFPLLCGIVSIFLFWALVRKIFTSKLLIWVSMTLFSINYLLIYYSSEFKQYSTDVLCMLVLTLLVINIHPKNCTKKALALMGSVFAGIFWLSHASLFVLAGIFVVHLQDFLKLLSAKFSKKLDAVAGVKSSELADSEVKPYFFRCLYLYVPAAISFVAFYFLHLKTVSNSTFMHDYWCDFFINNFQSCTKALSDLLSNVFFPNLFVLCIFICIVAGSLVLALKKEFCNDFKYLLYTVIVLIVASYFEIYPLSYRLCLFVVPALIIFFSAALLAVSKKRKIISLLILAIWFGGISSYFSYYPKVILKKNIWLRSEFRSIYEYVNDVVLPEDTVFLANDAHQQIKFYQRRFKLKNKIIELKEGKPDFDKMESGKKYMVVYCANGANRKAQPLEPLIRWLSENTRVLSQYAYYESYAIYVEKL